MLTFAKIRKKISYHSFIFRNLFADLSGASFTSKNLFGYLAKAFYTMKINGIYFTIKSCECNNAS